jgi:hypothetical protein
VRFERIETRLAQNEFSDELIEIMAQAAHEAFYEGLSAQGFHYGLEIDSDLKTHPALVDYEKLPEDLKEASRANVRDIPRKLRELGYRVEVGDNQAGLSTFSEIDLDRLAQLEHQRWMKHRLEGGWTLGPKTDPLRKIHASLVAWNELSEVEREKDREMVRSIPRILAEAGFVIVAE